MSPPALRVLQVAAEAAPLLKTGGLADVMGALPAALRGQGADVRLLLPGFASVLDSLSFSTDVTTVTPPWGGSSRLMAGRFDALGGIEAYVIRDDAMFQRAGGPYADARGQPWADNHRRFALLSLAALRVSTGGDVGWQPQVAHGHDWHAGLMPSYLHHDAHARRAGVRSVFTVHNLAYQGLFDADAFSDLGLLPGAWGIDGVEFHGKVSFMKAALRDADAVTTVSPRYAQEVLGADQGAGLQGVLAARADGVHGILNGVDASVWNPATDVHLAKTFSADRMAGKRDCKAALQRAVGLDVDAEALLFGVVSRLTEQKGLHLVQALVPDMLARGGQLVVLGSGDASMEQAFAAMAQAHPGRIAFRIGFDEPLAHRIYAGIDVVMVPSRFEPCGLTQLYGLAYGALPLVHRVGGLADTVVDASLENLQDGSATGFVFHEFSLDAAQHALRRAFALRDRPVWWRCVRATAMQRRFGWDVAAREYMALYRRLLRVNFDA